VVKRVRSQSSAGLLGRSKLTGMADSFDYTKDDDGGNDIGTLTVTVRNLVELSGRVIDDTDNDGLFLARRR
jgi:hypothetical protein